jgi:hypothetical protein
VKDLVMRNDLELSGWPSVTTEILRKGRQRSNLIVGISGVRRHSRKGPQVKK